MPKDSVVSRCSWSKWAHGQRQLHIFLQVYTLSTWAEIPYGGLAASTHCSCRHHREQRAHSCCKPSEQRRDRGCPSLRSPSGQCHQHHHPQPACSSPGAWYGACSLWKGQWKGSHPCPTGIWRGVEPGSSWRELEIGREAPAALREMPINIRKNIEISTPAPSPLLQLQPFLAPRWRLQHRNKGLLGDRRSLCSSQQ